MSLNLDNPFHGEFASADASALSEPNARITMYGRDKNVITLLSTDIVVITDIVTCAGAALTVTLFDGADATPDAGEIIEQGDWSANGGVREGAVTPHYCKVGTYPKVKTSGAGAVKVGIRGHIVSR